METIEIIETIQQLKRSKNVMAYTPSDMELMNEFTSLGDNHMEQKSLTKLEKLIERAIMMYVKENFKPTQRVSYNFNLHGMIPKYFEIGMRRFEDETYEYYSFSNGITKSDDDVKAIRTIRTIQSLFGNLAERFNHVKTNQYMRNGVIPKSLIKTVTIKEAIKGMLSPAFQPIVIELAEELRVIDTAKWKESVERNSMLNFITYDPNEEAFYDDITIWKNINAIIENNVSKFVYRLCDKLGGIELKSEIAGITRHIKSDYKFTIKVELVNGDQFEMYGSVVHNTSPLGTSFLQFPIIFTNMVADGKKVENGEYNFKETFKK